MVLQALDVEKCEDAFSRTLITLHFLQAYITFQKLYFGSRVAITDEDCKKWILLDRYHLAVLNHVWCIFVVYSVCVNRAIGELNLHPTWLSTKNPGLEKCGDKPSPAEPTWRPHFYTVPCITWNGVLEYMINKIFDYGVNEKWWAKFLTHHGPINYNIYWYARLVVL
jgi:hypothetical protein